MGIRKAQKELPRISGLSMRPGSDSVYLSEPMSGVKTIEPGFYSILFPMIGPVELNPDSLTEGSIRNEASKWNFEGQKIHDNLLREIEWFFSDAGRAFYSENGIPYRRAFMLYGPPGTGKSAIAKSGLLKAADCGCVVINNPKCEPEDLMILNKYKFGLAVLIDEFEKKDGYSISEFLDAPSEGGRFMIITSNEINSVHDRIKKRPGRIDRVSLVDRLSDGCILEMLKSRGIESQFEKIKNNFPRITPAIVSEIATRVAVGEDTESATDSVLSEFYAG